MKKYIIVFLLIPALALIAYWVWDQYLSEASSGTPVSETSEGSTPSPSTATSSTDVTPGILEHMEFLYAGGDWGLIISRKDDESFERVLTTNPVRRVGILNGNLVFEEQEVDQSWTLKALNLEALEARLLEEE